MKLSSRLLTFLAIITLFGCGESNTDTTALDDMPQALDNTPLSAEIAEATALADTVAAEIGEIEPENPVAPLATESPLPETNIFQDSWVGDLDTLAKRRVIRVLTVYSVGRYYLDNGREKGITYELLELFEDYVNKKHRKGKTHINVVFVPVARNQLIPALLEGRGDLIVAGLSITPERRQIIDFSIPASKDVSEILVTGPSAPELGTIDELSGQTIYVRQSSSYRQSVEELNLRLVAEDKDPVIIEPVSELLEDDDLIEMVNAGLLPWAIVDSYKPQLWEGVFTNLRVREDIVFRTGARLGWGLRLNSPILERTVDQFLKKHREGTMIGNVLANRYYRDFDWAANALDKQSFKRYTELEPYFRKYGEQYGVDFLVAAAQGYQESGLDQSRRSHAGAIGVMQLLRSTAKDPNVNIPNIEETEANIHAGIKYLAFLRSRYFSDPEIDERNSLMLALGAYNVGPRRMINLRNKAKRLGYDPNVWFDNVEVIAARDIGREPVSYVSNIYKYYISYRLSGEIYQSREAARGRAGI
jgi:membrane-bound lytic murein transglycosylase MltF